MTSSSPQMPVNEVNELAKARNRSAAERTLLSWVQNCLMLICSGVAIDRVGLAINQVFPQINPYLNQTLTSLVSLSTITAGVFLLILAAVQHPLQLESIHRSEYLQRPLRPNAVGAILAVVIFGIAALLLILVE